MNRCDSMLINQCFEKKAPYGIMFNQPKYQVLFGINLLGFPVDTKVLCRLLRYWAFIEVSEDVAIVVKQNLNSMNLFRFIELDFPVHGYVRTVSMPVI